MSVRDLPKDLLDQAWSLATKEKKRPRQASLRRSISTAYYALFHLLIADAVDVIAPNVESPARFRIHRWFGHSEMKQVCGSFLVSAPKHLKGVVDSVPSELTLVAKTFIDLQDARHDADYNLGKTYLRQAAQNFVQQSEDAFAAWKAVRKTSAANVFLLSLLLPKQWEKWQ